MKKWPQNQKHIGIIDLGSQDFSSGVADFLTDNTVQYLSYKFEKNNFGHFCDEISIMPKSEKSNFSQKASQKVTFLRLAL